MVEFLYHLLGVCGEHNHPHLINVGFILAGLYATFKIFQRYITNITSCIHYFINFIHLVLFFKYHC